MQTCLACLSEYLIAFRPDTCIKAKTQMLFTQAFAFAFSHNMYKFLTLLVLGFLATTWALPINQEESRPEPVQILSSEINKNVDGSYDSNYETSDGTKRQENAVVEVDEEGNPSLEVHGSYSYINEHGETVLVNYTAGKNGFVPVGTIINSEITQVAEAAKDLPKYEPEVVSKNGAI